MVFLTRDSIKRFIHFRITLEYDMNFMNFFHLEKLRVIYKS